MDRIDIRIPVLPLSAEELVRSENDSQAAVTSHDYREMVQKAVDIQRSRYKNEDYKRNSNIPAGKIRQYIELDDESQLLFSKAIKSLSLSTRACHSVLKVARSAADVAGHDDRIVSKEYLLEAIQMRRYGDNDFFWN